MSWDCTQFLSKSLLTLTVMVLSQKERERDRERERERERQTDTTKWFGSIVSVGARRTYERFRRRARR